MQLPRRHPSPSRRLRAAVLALIGLSAFALLVVAGHIHAAPAASAPGGTALPAARRAPPVEQVVGMTHANSAKKTAHGSAKPTGGCQVSVKVNQSSSGGSQQQSSSVSTSSSGGSCSTCVVSVQSSQSSANGSNTNVNSTTQSCTATGSGVHITNDGTSISVSSDGTSITISQNGQSISITIG